MKLFLKILALLPLSVLYILMDGFVGVAYHLIRYRVKVVRENLKKSFPEKTEQERKKIEKLFYRNLGEIFAETIYMLRMKKDEFNKRIETANIDLPLSYLHQQKSIIVLTGHQGNWEWLLQGCLAHSPYPIDGVYKKLNSPWADELMLNLRTKFGAHLVEMQQVGRELIKRKTITRTLAMVADQTPMKDDIQHWVPFLNQETGFFVGADKIAGMTGFITFYVSMHRIKRGYYRLKFHLIQEPPFDKTSFKVIDRYAELLEASIREQPESWLWSHRRWKHKRDVQV